MMAAFWQVNVLPGCGVTVGAVNCAQTAGGWWTEKRRVFTFFFYFKILSHSNCKLASVLRNDDQSLNELYAFIFKVINYSTFRYQYCFSRILLKHKKYGFC